MTTSLQAAEPATPVDAAVGVSWIPYLIAGVGLLALAVFARHRARSRASATVVEFLMIRGASLLLIGTLVFMLADAASDGDGLTAVDRPGWSWFVAHRTEALTVAAKIVTEVGSTLVMGALAVIAVVGLAWHRANRGDATLIAAVAAGAGLLVWISKPIVGRVRPPVELRMVTETNQSFPSGHALASMAILGVLIAVLAPKFTSRAAKASLYAGIAAFIILIGVSRLYLGVHWPTDVAGGWLTGFGWFLLCLTIRDVWRSYPVVLRLGHRTFPLHAPSSRPDQLRRADTPFRRATS